MDEPFAERGERLKALALGIHMCHIRQHPHIGRIHRAGYLNAVGNGVYDIALLRTQRLYSYNYAVFLRKGHNEAFEKIGDLRPCLGNTHRLIVNYSSCL